MVNLLENNFLANISGHYFRKTGCGIPFLKGHIKYLHLITCSSIDDIE